MCCNTRHDSQKLTVYNESHQYFSLVQQKKKHRRLPQNKSELLAEALITAVTGGLIDPCFKTAAVGLFLITHAAPLSEWTGY